MDAHLYKQEAFRQLQDTKYYQPISQSVAPVAAQKISSIVGLLRAQDFISSRQAAFLNPYNCLPRPRIFYLLPKVHKQHSTWPHPFMPAGRPIVSDCGSESYNICKYIDYYLRPLTTRHSSYIKDSYTFVNKIRNTSVDSSTILITGDITSLYTNMHIDRILASVRKLFTQYPDASRPDELLLQLLYITLTHNDFTFAGKLFLQILGVAMGRSYAPSTADAYMIEFDEKAQQGIYTLTLYSRFLDDIFALFHGTMQQVKQLENYLNTLIPDIHITLTASTETTNFLDVTIYKQYNHDGTCTLQTRTYFKPTHTHQLLHASSYHPRHTFNAILKSQFIRFKRLSSTRDDYNLAAHTLTNTLRTRGYSRRLIRYIQEDVWHNYTITNNRQIIPDTQHKPILPIISYFDTLNARLNRAWREEISKNAIMCNKYRIIPSYRIHKNFKKILTRAALADADNALKTKAHNPDPHHICTTECAFYYPQAPTGPGIKL